MDNAELGMAYSTGRKNKLLANRPISSALVLPPPYGQRTIAFLAPIALRHAQAVNRCFDAIAHLQFAQNIFHVSLNCGRADAKNGCNLTVGVGLGNKPKHTLFGSG